MRCFTGFCQFSQNIYCKSFLIMVFMIAFGIGLRASGLAPEGFIAVFYTGLGASLLTAGLRFLLAVSCG